MSPTGLSLSAQVQRQDKYSLGAIMIGSVRLLKSESLFFSLSEKKKCLKLEPGQYFANGQSKVPGDSLLLGRNCLAGLRPHPQRHQNPRHHVVCGNGGSDLDDLGGVEMRLHLRKGRVAHFNVQRDLHGIFDYCTFNSA
jgi:hypothetical protein